MAKLNFTPSEAIKGKFEVVNTTQPIYYSKIGTIDFRIINVEQAEELVRVKSIYIKKIGSKKAVL